LKKFGINVVAKNFPDPILTREKYWLSFIKELGANKNTMLIGHPSETVVAMCYAENNKILGSVLIGVCHIDLGIKDEKTSKYYNRPWNFTAIKNNQKFIVQFASTDDPFIPIEEARYVNKNLQTEYYEYTNEGHFGADKAKRTFPKLIEIIKDKIK